MDLPHYSFDENDPVRLSKSLVMYTEAFQSQGKMMDSKQEFLELIRTNSQRLRNLGVSRIGLFGSFVRDQVVANSDLDVLVEFETGKKTFDNFMELANFLEDTTARDVDLLTPESLSQYIGPHILEEVEYYAL